MNNSAHLNQPIKSTLHNFVMFRNRLSANAASQNNEENQRGPLSDEPPGIVGIGFGYAANASTFIFMFILGGVTM